MDVILLNGPMGVGKTTVGKHLADSYPGTAFIDGDWCMDLHPFVGSRETKEMAIDNILHMIGNYSKCSSCKRIVVVWLMDNDWVCRAMAAGICAIGLNLRSMTLMCDEAELIQRWTHDDKCDWRTDEWLKVSLASLPHFAALDNRMDTTHLTIDQVVQAIMK